MNKPPRYRQFQQDFISQGNEALHEEMERVQAECRKLLEKVPYELRCFYEFVRVGNEMQLKPKQRVGAGVVVQ